MRTKFLIYVFLGFCALFPSKLLAAAPTLGEPAPALVGATLDGKIFDLSALKGKVVVVNFWASWCPPCHEEMPALESVWRHYRGDGLEVIAISADRPRNLPDVKQVMKYFTYPAAMFNSLTKNDFGNPEMLPVTFVIGKEGNVEAIFRPDITPLTEQSLGEEVKTLLAAKPENKPQTKSEESKPEAKP